MPDDAAHPGEPAHPGGLARSGDPAHRGDLAHPEEGTASGTVPRGLAIPATEGAFPPATVAGRRRTWDALMDLALHEATHALASADVPVGAVVVGPDGRLLGVGRNRREETGDPTAHAEVLALRQAAATWGEWRLEGCTLVVTLEPCVMCAGALVLARVERLVLGAWDPKAGATGSVWDLVRDQRANHAVEVVGGVREDECARLLRDFFGAQR